MADERFITVQFCDDIRQEVGNKFSLIGCYGPSMLVNVFPVIFPKLCMQVRACTPATRPFQQLVIRVFKDDQVILEVPTSPESLFDSGELPEWARFQAINALFVMSPFQTETPCLLRVEAETEEGLLQGGTFKVEIES
jgi:hypothetical protein